MDINHITYSECWKENGNWKNSIDEILEMSLLKECPCDRKANYIKYDTQMTTYSIYNVEPWTALSIVDNNTAWQAPVFPSSTPYDQHYSKLNIVFSTHTIQYKCRLVEGWFRFIPPPACSFSSPYNLLSPPPNSNPSKSSQLFYYLPQLGAFVWIGFVEHFGVVCSC